MADPNTTFIDSRIDEALDRRGGGGHPPGMEERLTKLETEFGYVRRDLDEIKADLKGISSRLAELPTKRDLTNNTFAGLGIGLALMALIIGGIIGGLSYIKPDSPAPTPPPPVTITAPPPQIIYIQPPTSQVQQPASPQP